MLERFKLGQIVNAVGLKGETKVYPYCDYKERFEELDSLFIEDEERKIEKVRYQGELAIIKFENVSDRNAAEALKGKYLYIDRARARELDEDEYFIADLCGLEVVSEDGSLLGKLNDVIQGPGQDVYEVEKTGGGYFLVPAVEEFIKKIDMTNGTITIKVLEGMMD